LLLAVAPCSADAQSLLVIPDLSRGVDTTVVAEIARAEYLEGKANDSTGAEAAARAAVQDVLAPGRWDADLVGEMSPEVSKQFWGEARSGILPGSSIGLGSGSAAIYTEIGHVLSGAWRFAVGTTVAIAQEDEETEEPGVQQEAETPIGLNRFMAGGGSLSLQVLRPVWLLQAGTYNRFGVVAAPRVWANLPQLTSAENVDDYGWDAAASFLYQRHQNNDTPFMTVELRGGLVAGSPAFYQAIGHDDAGKFLYLAPTVTISIVEQVNIGASYFWSPDLDSPSGIRLNLSLLNKDRNPQQQGTGTGGGGR
jgi:hypothetical protein